MTAPAPRTDMSNKFNSSMHVEQLREVSTPAEMRAEIARVRRDDWLTHRAMDSADYTGASSEDRYTMLAYYALKSRAELLRRVYDTALTTPTQSFIIRHCDPAAPTTAPE